MRLRTLALVPLLSAAILVGSARADEITYWNSVMFQVAVLPVATSPLNMSRNAAIVQASVFEAVNGIERRYSSIHDTGLSAPRGASQRAAAIQAAYASLVHLYGSTPGALTILDAARASSLAGIASEAAVENSESIARGIAW